MNNSNADSTSMNNTNEDNMTGDNAAAVDANMSAAQIDDANMNRADTGSTAVNNSDTDGPDTKNKRNKEKKPNNWRVVKNILRINIPTLTIFVIIYNLLYSLVLVPAGKLLWSISIRLSPISYITKDNLLQLLLSPLVLIAILIIGAGLACWTFLNIVAIIVCVQASVEGRRIGVYALLKESVGHVVRALHWRNLPILLFAVLIIPFAHIIMTTNFIAKISIPEYINETIRDYTVLTILVDCVIAFAIFLTVQYMFMFQYFVLGKCSFREAAGKSHELIKGHRISNFLRLIWWDIRLVFVLVVYIIIFALLYLLGLMFISSEHSSIMFTGVLALQFVMMPFLSFITTCIETFAQYVFISVLFYRRLQAQQAELGGSSDGSVDGIVPPVLEDKKAKFKARLFIPAFAAIVLLVSLGGAWLVTTFAGPDEVAKLLLEGYPEVTSHRGYSAVAPENTLPAFQAAIDSGSQYAELDVQETSDGVVVLTHDTNLKRCTGKDINIYDITWDELQKLDAGSFFSEEFAGTRIPSLEEVIQMCKGKIKLNIEIKNSGHNPTLEADTARIILDNDFVDECVITSLSYESLEKVKEVAPEIKTGYILAVGVGDYYDLPASDFFSVETTFVTSGMVNAIHNRGKEVHAWTVDTEEDARKMIDAGVDNIITGNPPLIQEVINDEMLYLLDLLDVNGGGFDTLSEYFSDEMIERLKQNFEYVDDEKEQNNEENYEDIDIDALLEDA